MTVSILGCSGAGRWLYGNAVIASRAWVNWSRPVQAATILGKDRVLLGSIRPLQSLSLLVKINVEQKNASTTHSNSTLK